MEKERLRPSYGHTPIAFQRKNFPIAKHLKADVKATQNSLPKLAKLAQLIALNLSADGNDIVAIGNPKSLEMAIALVDMHMSTFPAPRMHAHGSVQHEACNLRDVFCESNCMTDSNLRFDLLSQDAVELAHLNGHIRVLTFFAVIVPRHTRATAYASSQQEKHPR